MAYRAIKYVQNEAGVFTKTNNKCNVDIQATGLTDLTQSYVLLTVRILHDGDDPFTGQGHIARDAETKYEGSALVKHFSLSSSVHGLMEENKYNNVRLTTMQPLELSSAEVYSLIPNGFKVCMITKDVTVLKFPLSRLSELAKTTNNYYHKSGEVLNLNFTFEDVFDFFKLPADTVSGYQIEKVEVVLFNYEQGSSKHHHLEYRTWNIEMTNMPDTADYRYTYEVENNCDQAILVSNTGEEIFALDDNNFSYRTAINNVDTTDRDVEFKSGLYFDRLIVNMALKSLNQKMNETDSVIPIVERLNVGKQTNLLRVILKADAGQTMGERINYLFKRVLKSV